MRRAPRLPGFGAIPLLFAALIQGLPLTFELAVPEQLSGEEMHDATLAAVTVAGYEKTIIPLLVWVAVYGLAAWSLARTRGRLIPASLRLPTALLLGIMLLSAAWSSYPLKNVMSTTHAAGAILIALAAAHHYRSDPGAAVRQVGYALGLNVTLHVVASALLPAYAVDPSGRWTGLAGNANSLGALGAFALWANFAALRAARGGRRALHLGLGAFAVLALVGSESRTSLVSGVVAVVGTVFLGRLQRVGALRLGVVFPIVVFGAMALALFFVVSGTGWSDVTGLLGRSSEMSGRVVIWAQATELIAARPVLGWGFDENARVIELTGLPYFQFHNGYLDVLVRGGAIAATVLFVLAARGLRALGRATVQHGPFPDVGVVCYPFLVALAIQNITEVSFLRARNVPWMLALFVIYWAAIVAARRQEPTRSPVRFEPCATPTVADEGGVRA